MAFQLNENIRSVGVYALCGLVVRKRAKIDKMIESLAEPRAEFAIIVDAMRIGGDLETGSIVKLE